LHTNSNKSTKDKQFIIPSYHGIFKKEILNLPKRLHKSNLCK